MYWVFAFLQENVTIGTEILHERGHDVIFS